MKTLLRKSANDGAKNTSISIDYRSRSKRDAADHHSFMLTTNNKGIYALLLDMPGPVNTIKKATLLELDQILDVLSQDRGCKGLVITTPCDKAGIAGADIKEIYALQHDPDPNAFVKVTEEAKRILRRLSKMPFPTVAAMNGSWRGGGFELALFCNHIIGIEAADANEQSTEVQLPEIKIGAIPGFEGNLHVAQRMARLTDAVDFVASAKSFNGREALNKGLVDALVPDYVSMLKAAERYCRKSALARRLNQKLLRLKTNWRRARQTAGELKGLLGPQRSKVLMEVVAPSIMEHFGATTVGFCLLLNTVATIAFWLAAHTWFGALGSWLFVPVMIMQVGLMAMGAAFDQSMRQWLARMVEMQIKSKTNLTGPVSAAGLIMQMKDLPWNIASGMESQLFAQEARSPFARGLVSLFVKKAGAKDAFAEVHAPQVNVLGIVGAGGPMGAGIAAIAAASTLKKVVLIDIKDDLLKATLKRIEKHLDELNMAAPDVAFAMSRIVSSTDYAPLVECDAIIEAVPENMALKRKIYAQIMAVMQARFWGSPWFLFTNTSALDLDLLAEELGEQAQRFAGVHAFNPPEKMQVIEVGRGLATTDETMAVGVRLVTLLKKSPLPVLNKRAFKVNRELGPYMIVFAHLLAEGVPPEEMDKAIKHTGAPMGPAALFDKVGVDIVASVAKTLAAEFDQRMALPQESKNVLAILLKLKDLGEKSGRGIYVWENGKPARDAKGRLVINPALKEAFPGLGENRTYSREAIQFLLLGAIVNEAVRAIEDGVVAPEHRRYGDAAFVLGTGLTAVYGGPIGMLNAMGVRTFTQLSRVIATTGDASWRLNFVPCPLLLEHERTGMDISLSEGFEQEKVDQAA